MGCVLRAAECGYREQGLAYRIYFTWSAHFGGWRLDRFGCNGAMHTYQPLYSSAIGTVWEHILHLLNVENGTLRLDI